MAGGRKAVASGQELRHAVAELSRGLGLEVREEVEGGRRILGSRGRIARVLTYETNRRTLGLECKFQEKSGSADEKIPATILDIAAWPIPGLVVFSGEGFSENMRAYLHSTGKAVDFEDLESWLRLFFGLASG